MATPNTTQPTNQPIPASAGTAPAGYLPTYGAAGIFTGYAPAPQGTQNVNVGGTPTKLPPTPNPTPTSPQAPTTPPATTPQVTQPGANSANIVPSAVGTPTQPNQSNPGTVGNYGTPGNQTPTESNNGSSFVNGQWVQNNPNQTNNLGVVTQPSGSETPSSTGTSTGQTYFVQGTDAQGKPTTTYYDADGNALPGNPGGTPTQLPSAPTAGTPVSNPNDVNDLSTAILNATTANTDQLNTLNEQADQAYSQYETQLSQIQNGTFPLTPAQQQLYDSTSAQFDTLRTQQTIANTALTQGTAVAEARSGETEGGSQTALGNVGAAINTGIQKLAALDAQGSQALATLQSGFATDNLKVIQDSYDAFQTYQTQKEKTINDIYTATVGAEKDLRDFTYTQTQDNIKNTLANQQLTDKEKQDAITNSLNQAQLDEKTKTDMQDYALKEQSLQLQQQANDLLQGAYEGGTPASQTLPNGNIDPNAQAAFLAKLPPTAQTLVEGLDDYTISPSTLPTRLTTGGTGLTQQQALALVKAYDPNYDESQYAARAKYNSDFNSGAINTQRTNVNTAINHLNDLKTAADALAPLFSHGGVLGIGTQTYNNIADVIANNAGDPRVIAYNNIANKVATEISGAYGENTGGERTAQDVLSEINSSAAQKDALINSTVTLLSGLTNSIYQDYQSNMGKAPAPNSIIFPTTQALLSNLQSKGIGTGVSFTPSQYSGVSNEDLISSASGGSNIQSADPQTFFQLFNNTQSAATNVQQ